MMCISATASDSRASNGFKQKLQCTCRDGLGRDALSLAAEAALNDAIDEGYSMIREEAATGAAATGGGANGGAEGGAATGGGAA